MKKYLGLFLASLLLLFCVNVFGSQDQFRIKALSMGKDTVRQAIINKQAADLQIIKKIDTLKKDSIKNRSRILSLNNERKVIENQITVLNDLVKNNDNNNNGGTSPQSTELSIATLGFGALLIIAILIFQGFNSEKKTFQTYKIVGIMFIGTVSVFLIPAGFDSQQITPVVGLLGTLAGYLVGTSQQKSE